MQAAVEHMLHTLDVCVGAEGGCDTCPRLSLPSYRTLEHVAVGFENVPTSFVRFLSISAVFSKY